MTRNDAIPDPDTVAKLESVEQQLVEVIRTLCAIEALAAAWRDAKAARPDLLSDSFLFGTVYEALWDSLVVGLGRIWDGHPKSASLPNLAHVFAGDDAEAVAAREHVSKGLHHGRERLRVRRHKVVAHRDHPLPATFDTDYGVDSLMARKDVSEVMERLRLINERLRRTPMHWGTTFDTAREQGRESLARWGRGDPEAGTGKRRPSRSDQ